MVRYCSVYGCLENDASNKKTRFFKFPSDESRCKHWIKAIERIDLERKDVYILNKCYFVCDLHFAESDFLKKKLKGNAVPTLFLPQFEEPSSKYTQSKYTQTDLELATCCSCKCKILAQCDPSTSQSSQSAQTTEILREDTSRKRKLQTELKSETKNRRLLESTAELKTGNKPDNTRNSGDSRDDSSNDSEDTEDEPSDTEEKLKITLYESDTTKPEVASPGEPEVKVEFAIKEEEDPLKEEAAASGYLQNIYKCQTTCESKDVPPTQLSLPPSKCVLPSHLVPPSQGFPMSHTAQAVQGAPSFYLVPLTQGVTQSQSNPPSKAMPFYESVPSKGVPPSQDAPPCKRRRDADHHSTTTTLSHTTTPIKKEPTALCTDTSPSSTVATSSTSGSKVDVFVLKKSTRPVDENDD